MFFRVAAGVAFALLCVASSVLAGEAPAQRELTVPISVKSEAEPFGLQSRPVTVGTIPRKWSTVEAEIRADSAILTNCRDGAWCPQAARRLLAIVDEGRSRNGLARIGVINRAINLAIVATPDIVQWHVADHWSAPLETFTTGRGDCEDYAIAKYVALRAAGFAADDVKLVVLRNAAKAENAKAENHAVVAVRLEDGWVILDNRWLALVRDAEMGRATPLFVLDDSGVRQFVSPASLARLQQTPAGSF
jgi:predicted transglutaminase-like cysteine proteinase